jgi:hypothetical protein
MVSATPGRKSVPWLPDIFTSIPPLAMMEFWVALVICRMRSSLSVNMVDRVAAVCT